jgi:hypothetical protein
MMRLGASDYGMQTQGRQGGETEESAGQESQEVGFQPGDSVTNPARPAAGLGFLHFRRLE